MFAPQDAHSPIIARSAATKQSTLPVRRPMDCFASLAMTVACCRNARMVANETGEEFNQHREQQMSEAASLCAGWRPATHYPDPAIHAIDPRFEKYWLKLSAIERLATRLRWGGGPGWVGGRPHLFCS